MLYPLFPALPAEPPIVHLASPESASGAGSAIMPDSVLIASSSISSPPEETEASQTEQPEIQPGLSERVELKPVADRITTSQFSGLLSQSISSGAGVQAAESSEPLKSMATVLFRSNLSGMAGSTSISPAQQLDPSQPVAGGSQRQSRLLSQSAPGAAPRLQTEPSSPQQAPFRPTQLAVQGEVVQGGGAPSITVITPSAYTQAFGSVGVGVGFQSRTRFSNDADGVVGTGIGLGDAQNAVGFDVAINSASTFRSGFFNAGTVSVKVGRALPEDFSIAAGILNLATWGLTDSGTSGYGVVTKAFRLSDNEADSFSLVYLSAGFGGGQFRSQSDINNKIGSVGFFGSLAVRVAQPVNAIAEWTGQDLTLGFSVTPIPEIPLVITPAVTDITRNAGDGARFILGIGYGLSF